MGIVVFGASFMDIKGYPLAQYIPCGRNSGKVVEVHGGVSRNVAENIANIELAPTFVSVVDNGPLGEAIIEKLERHRVDTRYMIRTENGLGKWLAVFDNDGDVIASISARPDLSPIADVLEKHGDTIFSEADSIVVEIDLDASLLKTIFRLAEKYDKDVYAIVSNMSIAMARRDLMKRTACIVCNKEEASLLFSEDFSCLSANELAPIVHERATHADYSKIVVTLGEEGAVYSDAKTDTYGITPAQKTAVVDTTGCGDAFFSGVTVGLTYRKTLADACQIGSRLASAVISTTENVCPRFMPKELGLDIECELDHEE